MADALYSAAKPIANAAVGGSQVLLTAPGTVFGVNAVVGASAGFLMLFDATAAPADGAVTPIWCEPIAANAGLSRDFSMPIKVNTGAVLVFSTTGPFTKTVSNTAFLMGKAST